ncbi:MAG: hypothetical protein OXT09_00265 [Myxococcales bacterium]|nr:hypothetical protein [Myxococcales bacterium]
MIALPPDVAVLEERRFIHQLGACQDLLAEHRLALANTYGSAGLDLIALPPLRGGALVPAQLRAAAVMYWAMEVERAGILPFVEALVSHVVRGRWLLQISSGMGAIMGFHRDRREHFDVGQRAELYSRLFGGAGSSDLNHGFEGAMRTLATTLADIGRQALRESTLHLQVRASIQARQLAGLLGARAGGVVGFAAQDIVGRVAQARDVLRQRDVALALGGGGPLQLVRRHARAVLGRPVAVDRHLRRAEAGHRVLRWVADSARSLDGGTVAVDRGDAVVHSAEAWLAGEGGG